MGKIDSTLAPQTRAIDLPYERRDAYDALAVPVYRSVAFEFDDAQAMADAFTGRSGAPDYSRTANPTVTNLERRVKALTGANSVTAFNSGMAAISNTMLAIASHGKTIITSRHLFGNTFSLLTLSLRRFGVRTRLVDLTHPEEVEQAADEEDACCIFFEIITNPQLEVADIGVLSDIARRHGIPLVADTTMIPFTQFSASKLGVDIEVLSSTKYISGGATSLGGLVIDHSTHAGFTERIKGEMLFNFGSYMTPDAAWLQTLGLETLNARYGVQSGNALQLAKDLQQLSSVKKVNYVGLDDNPYHALAQRQFGPTAGAMLTIDLESQQACWAMLNKLRLVHRATNLFDNRTLAIHPYSTIFGLFSPAEKEAMDISDTTIRLSIGLENEQDILNDIKQALQ